MKLFKFEFAHDVRYAAFEDAEQAYEQRATVDTMYQWTPVEISEVTVDGYEITLKPVTSDNVPVEQMDKHQLKQYLTSHNIQFVPQWGLEKLREVALQSA